MTPDFAYVQLPGSYRGFFRKASLWEGADHILSVSGSRFNEEYRRFYYRDIQVIIVERRARAGSWGWWGVFLILLIIAGFSIPQNDPRYSWAALGLLSIIVFIRLDLAFRRSCRCSIQTAVSREPLPSIIRRKDAEAVVNRLRTRIAAEQGELPYEIPSSEDDVAAAVVPPDPSNPSPSQVLAEAAARERRELATRGVNFAILALFILLLNAVFTLWFSPGGRPSLGQWPRWAGYLFIAAEMIPIFLSLQNLSGLRALRGLQAVLIMIVVLGGARLVMGLAMAQIQAALVRTQGANFVFLFSHYYVNTNGGIQFAFAAVGLILIFAKWNSYHRGEVSTN